MILNKIFALCLLSSSVVAQTKQEYEALVKIYVWDKSSPTTMRNVTVNGTATGDGCDPNGKFAFIVHGWLEGLQTNWVNFTVKNLLKHRGGCVYFFDYNYFSKTNYYFALTPHFMGIAAVLEKKLRNIGNYDRQYLFGFSFGSRLCIEAGKRIGNQSIDRMDLCDSAGPGFNMYEDPTPAAKNVACISTSYDMGTYIYNCHQNFRMGYCGYSQMAAYTYPIGSHGLCPYMYNMAFNHDFVPNNYYGCTSTRLAKNLTNDVKMGYLGAFNRSAVRGDIFVMTAQYPPYTVVDNVINNRLTSLSAFNSNCSP